MTHEWRTGAAREVGRYPRLAPDRGVGAAVVMVEPLGRALHATVYEPMGATGGPPILLLHGLLTSGEAWRPVVPFLPPSRRIVVPDLRGHGKSASAPRDVSLDELVDDLFAVLDAFEARRAILVGLSLGGLVCLRAALCRPDRVAGLALVATPVLPETAESRARRLRTLDAMRRLGNRPVLRGMAGWLFGRTTRRRSPETVERWLASLEDADPVGIRRTAQAALRRTDVRPWLERLPLPALVIVGAEDALLSAAELTAVAGNLSGAILRELPEAGHLVPLERPQALGTTLGRWIDGADDHPTFMAGDRDARPIA
jgi:pimeloyl-ACP methyl ester carboxylesterase